MENKYYTPTLEEFHVCFECETLNIENGKWGKYTIKYDDRYLEDLEIGHIRTKYLDKDDIESLGFIKDHSTVSKILDSSCDVYINKNLNIILAHYPPLNKISTLTRDPSLNEFLLKGVWDNKQVNLITIKNKTELKRLLKQLEI